MKKTPKRVQLKPYTFQDWWDKEGHNYGVECFKACRAAWQEARRTKLKAAQGGEA